MNQLIDNILKSSRYGFSDGNKFQEIHIEDILTQVKSNLQRQILSTGAIIRMDIPDLPIYAVRIKIEQLIQNLLTNAMKFRRQNEVPQIDIRLEDKGDDIQLSITDNGIGIAKDAQESIFQMFRQLNRTSDMAGVGLGLTICRKIAEQHGGTIWVDPNRENGSTFHVTLKKDPVAYSNQEAA